MVCHTTPVSKTSLTSLPAWGFQVHRILPMRNYATKQPLPSFLCDVFRNELLPSIYEVTVLLDFQVSINVYHSKKIRMCFRCQRFNHSSDVCTFDFVCVKCAGNHPSKECKVPRRLIKCANCSQQHCANYSKCPRNPGILKE